MPVYKLKYFNGRGRAEVARLMFAEAGQKYEDIRIKSEDWPAEKTSKDNPFGQLPVLMIDDKPLPQTFAIIRYLARELKLESENSILKANADMIVEALRSAFEKVPLFEKDEKKKAELMKEAFEKHVCPTYAVLEKRFSEEKSDYLVGTKVKYADLVMMNYTMMLENMKPGFMNEYPKLKALNERVQNRPNIKKWLETRPVTQF